LLRNVTLSQQQATPASDSIYYETDDEKYYNIRIASLYIIGEKTIYHGLLTA